MDGGATLAQQTLPKSGEDNAMLYLRDRMAKEDFHCRLFHKIKVMVEAYAKPYEDRFTEIAKSQGVTYSCSWT